MITKKLIAEQTIKSKVLKVKTFIASFFSVFFSMSILKELYSFTNLYFFIFITIFVLYFITNNEAMKVNSLRKGYSGKRKYYLTSLVTFVISVGLSVIGIYFWTNQTTKQANSNNVEMLTELTNVQSTYNKQIDSIRNIEIDDNHYNVLLNDKKYWSTRSGNDSARKEYRKQVVNIENEINGIIKKHDNTKKLLIASLESELSNKQKIVKAKYNVLTSNIDKNNFITGIFIILVFITEIFIIIFASEYAKEKQKLDRIKRLPETKSYLLYRKIVSMLYATKTKDDRISIKDIQFMPIKISTSKEKSWKVVKHLFNLMDSIDMLINVHVNKNGVPMGNLNMDKNDALNRLDAYYNEVLRFYS